MSSCQICKAAIALGVLAVVFVVAEYLRRRRSSPHRPALTSFLDAVCTIPSALRLGPWGRKNGMRQGLEAAKASTGLSDVGGKDQKSFLERYDISRSLGLERSKVKFSPVGYFVMGNSCRRRMETRLRFFDYMKKHPQVDAIEVKNPIFVIGFPRTGTTFLHELLGLHPDVRMHYTWEQMEPMPRTDDESIEALIKDRKLRYDSNKVQFDFLMKLGGDAIQSIHRIGYDEPEECTTPCALELPWNVTELAFHIFAAKETIEHKGAGDTFHYYKNFLKIMTYQAPDRRDQKFTWMLKCPFHLPYLNELYEAFPDATVVWTHRDPVECIGSACSLYETLMMMIFEESSIDRVAIGKAVLEYTRLALDMAMKTFERLGNQIKFVHIRYADNVKNSKATCRDIINKAGLEFSSEYERRMDEYLAKSKAQREAMKAKKGNKETLHAYKAEDYGLSDQLIRDTFADYIAKYSLSEK